MKKQLIAACVLGMITLTTNVYAADFASVMAKTLVGGVAGGVVDDAGRVIGAGADKAQEALNGGQYKTYIEGDLKSTSENNVASIQTGQNAVVSVGGVTLNNSRFNNDVTFKTKNNIGKINIEDDAMADIGSINFSNTRVNGKTDIRINNDIPGGVHAGKGSVVSVGSFHSF